MSTISLINSFDPMSTWNYCKGWPFSIRGDRSWNWWTWPAAPHGLRGPSFPSLAIFLFLVLLISIIFPPQQSHKGWTHDFLYGKYFTLSYIAFHPDGTAIFAAILSYGRLQASPWGAMASRETWGTRGYAHEQAFPTFGGPCILSEKITKWGHLETIIIFEYVPV